MVVETADKMGVQMVGWPVAPMGADSVAYSVEKRERLLAEATAAHSVSMTVVRRAARSADSSAVEPAASWEKQLADPRELVMVDCSVSVTAASSDYAWVEWTEHMSAAEKDFVTARTMEYMSAGCWGLSKAGL